MKFLPFLVIGILASCTVAPTPLGDGKGGSAKFVQWGGKWMLTYNADGSMSLTGDNEISFQHGAQALTTMATGFMSMKVSLAKEVTERFLQGQITERMKAEFMTQIALANTEAELAIVTAQLAAAAP